MDEGDAIGAAPVARAWVAVIGGATAGAEVAAYLAARNVNVAVFDQHARPYGKIEDGLPRWHEALRRKEFHHIDERLGHPNVHYVPCTKVGRDVDFTEMVTAWGFAAVVLACGAWRDRALPVPDAQRFVNRGLVYQNPFVIAFNHAHEPNAPALPLADGALVLGGGLAAIDVAKILMLETSRRALAERGHTVSVSELEHKGIPATLASLRLTWAELELAGCTIVYRRQPHDMPLVDVHEPADAEQIEKAHKTRLKLLNHAQEKFLFKVEPLASPEAIVADADERVAGMLFRRNEAQGDKVVATSSTFTLPTTLVVSAIGSVPEPIKGIPLRGELFDFSDQHLGTLPGFPNVFSVGNVVTGRGNIAASRKHARDLSETAVSAFLGLGGERDAEAKVSAALSAPARTQAQVVASAVHEHVEKADATGHAALVARVAQLQRRVGYTGNYAAWMALHPAL
ncbi:MAG: FAD-dependent oxidoreductase [Deltaproteobacteria bacterium]|nr:FAD-dependent oxidoreductase [Deltaproteobacteria bacterium]